MKSVVSKALSAFAIFAAGLLPVAQAGTISGGSALLSPAQHGQLETWLGQGGVNLNNVFTLQPGMDSLDFHAVADGVGPTFSLMLVGNGTDQWLVGGYNPQSWDSMEHWHETPNDEDRVAFIFNLTNDAVFRQVPATYILPSQGQKQTWNSASMGPSFGEGGDLWVTGDLLNAYSAGAQHDRRHNPGAVACHDDPVRDGSVHDQPGPGAGVRLDARRWTAGTHHRRGAQAPPRQQSSDCLIFIS
jgi:hypothetical protein